MTPLDLTPEQIAADRRNRARLLAEFPRYAPAASFSIDEGLWPRGRSVRWTRQTIMTIVFDRRPDPAAPEPLQLNLL